MAIISILNQKGGVGKTTLSMHLARALQLQGANVTLVDSDPQGSSRDWAAVCDDYPVPVIGIDRPTIGRDLKIVTKQDFIIIDGAPRSYDIIVSALKASDCVIIPIQPSPVDIWATSDLVDLVKQRIEVTDGKLKAAFVVSRAIKGTKLGAKVLNTIADYGLPVLKTCITQRVIYPTVADNGTTALDQEPKGEAAEEIKAFASEVRGLLL
ncbi:MAG: AAA family ATPase [Acetobacter sp.]|nr:AAA family ATPase [Acetobacter sp.]MBQ5516493.1 AAA family ATPase [Acetobacter sp.]